MPETDQFDQLDPLSPLESALLNQVPWTPVDDAATDVEIAYGDPDGDL